MKAIFPVTRNATLATILGAMVILIMAIKVSTPKVVSVQEQNQAEQAQKALELAQHTAKVHMLTEQYKDAVRAGLKDPESVQIRGIMVTTENNIVCGDYNAKNGFGGYVGFQEYCKIF